MTAFAAFVYGGPRSTLACSRQPHAQRTTENLVEDLVTSKANSLFSYSLDVASIIRYASTPLCPSASVQALRDFGSIIFGGSRMNRDTIKDAVALGIRVGVCRI